MIQCFVTLINHYYLGRPFISSLAIPVALTTCLLIHTHQANFIPTRSSLFVPPAHLFFFLLLLFFFGLKTIPLLQSHLLCYHTLTPLFLFFSSATTINTIIATTTITIYYYYILLLLLLLLLLLQLLLSLLLLLLLLQPRLLLLLFLFLLLFFQTTTTRYATTRPFHLSCPYTPTSFPARPLPSPLSHLPPPYRPYSLPELPLCAFHPRSSRTLCGVKVPDLFTRFTSDVNTQHDKSV